jgi:hypothetical protein
MEALSTGSGQVFGLKAKPDSSGLHELRRGIHSHSPNRKIDFPEIISYSVSRFKQEAV